LNHSHGTSPTESLKEDHRIIERMLNILNVATERLKRGEEVSPEVFTKAVDFIRNFADRCHHGKEEDTLFPRIELRVPRQGGPTGVMRMEHDQGRAYVRGLADAAERYAKGDNAVKQAIIDNARGYVNLLSQHIPKEDDILYPLADQMCGPDEQKELLEKFEEIEKERIGEGKHHEYIHLVHDLEKTLGIE